ncbi:sulfatase [bacterium]|nr:sulfatase [bacterium]
MSRPNILILLCDQLRRQALGCYGDPDAHSPNLDAFAERGVRFANACSTYPICVPFRFSLMTGEYAHTRSIPGIEWSMSPTERTMADEFNEAGYDTVYIGKWHLDGGHGRLGSARQINRTRVPRSRQGRWQKWYGFELRNGPFDTCYFEDDDPTPIDIDGYQTDGLFEIGMNHMQDRARENPFCMVISVEPPHPPWEAPEDLTDAWLERDLTLPPNYDGDFLRERKIYYAMVENLDQNVGRMMAFLDEKGMSQDTVVMFVSDHGELSGAHGLRSKQYPYEESVGIPLMVIDPRHPEGAGSVVADPTNTEDLFPTVLGLAGLNPKNSLHGEDLSSLISGKSSGLDREGVLLEFVAELRQKQPFYDAVWRGIRTERYKYTVSGDNFGGKPWQFFDLEADPYEMKNLVDNSEHEAEAARHHRMLAEELVKTDDHFILMPAFGCDGVNCWDGIGEDK